MAKIQYASDLHLEFYSDVLVADRNKLFSTILTPSAPYLILAGDIGYPSTEIFQQFLSWCCQNWSRVFFVSGNHEYYGSSIEEVNEQIEQLSNKLGFLYLNNRVAVLRQDGGDTVILGTTLWSHVPVQAADKVSKTLNDYRCIKYKNDVITVNDTNEFFSKNEEWLSQELVKLKTRNVRVIVATHHAPYPELTSAPVFRGKPTNCAFATDMSHLFPYLRDGVWIHGHTHFSSTFKPPNFNVTITSNQYGYSDKTAPPDFSSRVLRAPNLHSPVTARK